MTSFREDTLTAYLAVLRSRAVPGGMIAKGDADRLDTRHIGDSLRALSAFRAGDKLAYDLGSGSGLPGIPLAISLPHVRFVLAEVRASRARFLRETVSELGLTNVTVHAGRAEDLPPVADVATARALAPLERAWPLAAALLKPSGRLVYFAGASLREPESQARAVAREGPDARVSVLVESGTPLVIMERT